MAFERYGRLVEIVVRVKRRKKKQKWLFHQKLLFFGNKEPVLLFSYKLCFRHEQMTFGRFAC